MSNGFMMNNGVPQGANRENPEGVQPGPTPDLSVPNNAPLVAPANNTTRYESDNGALSLARALGGINFGAIARTFEARSAAKRQLKDEQDRAAGMTEYARLSSELGTDYDTLVRSGRLPASMSPAFKLGFDIKAAQVEFDRFRDDMAKRGIDAPSSVPFASDPRVMQPYLQRLNGVRPEAVAEFFLKPAESLGADDTKRYAKYYDTEQTNKLHSNALESFQRSIERGDNIGAATSNALNVYALSHQLTDDNAKDLITTAGPSILRAARDPITGRVSIGKASKMVEDFAQTKLSEKGFGGRSIETQFPKELAALKNYVYGGVKEVSDAENAQYTAQQNDAKMNLTDWLVDPATSPRNSDGTLKLPSMNSVIAKARDLGLDASDVPEIYKKWDGAGGNVSQADDYSSRFRATALSVLQNQTDDQREKYFANLPNELSAGKLTPNEYLVLMDLRKSFKQNEARSGLPAGDRKRLETTLGDRMSILWDGNGYLNMIHGSNYKNVAVNQVPRKIANRLTGLAVTWAEGSPLWDEYRDAQRNVATDPEGPGRVLDRVVDKFLTTNRDALRDGITRAVVSNDPDGNLQKLKLGGGTPQPAPAARPKPTSQPTPQPAAPRTPNVQSDAAATAKARAEMLNTSSGSYQWYATYIRSKRPGTTDAQILNRLRSLSPITLRRLSEKYNSLGK